MAVFRDRALMLKRTPFGESSLVAQVLTERHGRVHLLAKGAYRPTTRHFAVLDLFATLELEWSTARGRELDLLRRGDLERRRRHMTDDLERYRAGLAMLELTNLAARPGHTEAGLFRVLETGLTALEAGVEQNRALVVFDLGFLHNLGLNPALTSCAACGGQAGPVTRDGGRVAFSAGAGGRLCRPCAEEARASGRRVGTLPIQVLAAAARLSRDPDDPDPEIARPGLLIRVRDFLERFLDYHLETRPKSHRAFLALPNRNAKRAP